MNLICNKCTNREICLVYDNIKNYLTFANINITECQHFICSNTSKTEDETAISKINSELTRSDVRERNLDLINELSNKNRLIKENSKVTTSKPKPKINTAQPIKLDYVCLGCGATTFSDDGAKCDNCGKDICSCCATIDGDTQELYCPDCWSKA